MLELRVNRPSSVGRNKHPKLRHDDTSCGHSHRLLGHEMKKETRQQGRRTVDFPLGNYFYYISINELTNMLVTHAILGPNKKNLFNITVLKKNFSTNLSAKQFYQHLPRVLHHWV